MKNMPKGKGKFPNFISAQILSLFTDLKYKIA